jgi:hypothetical protein
MVIHAVVVTGILMSFAFADAADTGVTVVTDKLEYKRGETINITLINNFEESIFSHIGSGTPVFCIKHIEIRTPTGQQERLFAQCQYPHCTSDIDAPGEIKSGESETFVWEPLVFVEGTSETVLPRPGLYRLLISYEDNKKTKWETVSTNQFTIYQEEEK